VGPTPSVPTIDLEKEKQEIEFLQSQLHSSIRNSIITNSSTSKSSMENELFKERLKQYEELAHDLMENSKNIKYDTISDAEKSNGVIEGGSWEHKKRALEMLRTAQKNLELTAASSGKHHISDYLPESELAKFYGTKSQKDSSSSVIGNNNIGYQILEKSGWNNGSGIGAHGNGIVNPIEINNNNVNNSQVGIGVKSQYEVDSMNDDEFEIYRKKMMLSYKYRPNPLNNPRRDYY
jgi:splicing factor 4